MRAGITDFRWHDLRHTWASWHIQQGTPLHVLQELGGWSDIRMVQRYAHLSADHLAVYADRLSQLRVISTNPAQSGDDGNEKRLEERLLTVCFNLRIMARPERFELPTAWFVVLSPNLFNYLI